MSKPRRPPDQGPPSKPIPHALPRSTTRCRRLCLSKEYRRPPKVPYKNFPMYRIWTVCATTLCAAPEKCAATLWVGKKTSSILENKSVCATTLCAGQPGLEMASQPPPRVPQAKATYSVGEAGRLPKGGGGDNKRACSPGVCAGPAERALDEPRKDHRTSPLGGSPGGSPSPPLPGDGLGGFPGVPLERSLGVPWGFSGVPCGVPRGTLGGQRDRGHGPKQTRNRHIFHDKNPFTLCATEPMRHRGGGAMLTFDTELLVYPMRDPMRRKEYVREIPPG